jgi:tRNA 2-thiouridine synthesizing protein A
MITINVELDTRGMYCRMPIVKLKKTTKTMEPGQTVKLIATDPGSERDVPAWANKTGAEILETSEENGEFVFIIKVN